MWRIYCVCCGQFVILRTHTRTHSGLCQNWFKYYYFLQCLLKSIRSIICSCFLTILSTLSIFLYCEILVWVFSWCCSMIIYKKKWVHFDCFIGFITYKLHWFPLFLRSFHVWIVFIVFFYWYRYIVFVAWYKNRLYH